MTTEVRRSERARELAEWFRAMAGGDGGDLMARTAHALERIAETPPEARALERVLAPDMPIAINDNARVSRKRSRH